MKKDDRESLDFFLEKYGVNGANLSYKEKISTLKNIIVEIRLREDLLEENYVSKNSDMSSSQYVDGIKELYIDEGYAREHILRIRFTKKKSTKLKIKRFFQKTITFKK